MPGIRAKQERTALLAIRVTPQEKAEWKAYAQWEGVSALVRFAVRRFIEKHPDPAQRPSFYNN